MFSLSKLSYIKCNENEKLFYDEDLETMKIDVKPCCIELLQYIRNKTYFLNNLCNTISADIFCDCGKLKIILIYFYG